MNNFSKYIIIGAGVLFIFVTIFNVIKTINVFSQTAAFRIAGEPGQVGIFDPTIEIIPETGRGYMAYASISRNEQGLPVIGVNLAVSGNSGGDWNFRRKIFEGKPGSMTVRQDGQLIEVPGEWRYEMPSLVYTPGDKGREWKIYAYRYFWNGDINLARQTGTISYKETVDPTTEWSEEKWIFSANQYNPPAPYNRLVLLHVNVLSPALQNVKFYADPGAFHDQGILYITLSAFETDVMRPDKIILIASRDFGNSWQYLGDIMTRQDLAGLDQGDTSFSSGQVIRKENKNYLAVSFGNDIFNGYKTRIFEFTDLNRAALLRDNGVPVDRGGIDLNIETLSTLGGGPADYDENAKVGLLISRMTTGADNSFQIGNYGHDFLD